MSWQNISTALTAGRENWSQVACHHNCQGLIGWKELPCAPTHTRQNSMPRQERSWLAVKAATTRPPATGLWRLQQVLVQLTAVELVPDDSGQWISRPSVMANERQQKCRKSRTSAEKGRANPCRTPARTATPDHTIKSKRSRCDSES